MSVESDAAILQEIYRLLSGGRSLSHDQLLQALRCRFPRLSVDEMHRLVWFEVSKGNLDFDRNWRVYIKPLR